MKLKNIISSLLLATSLLSTQAFANGSIFPEGYVSKLDTWVYGSDEYGVWVTLTAGATNTGDCGLTYYLPHTSDNKQLVYGALLSAQVSQTRVRLQSSTDPVAKNKLGICRASRVTLCQGNSCS
ncbi:hypothetical protein [Pseudoalteromonas luteoviolacea]|uniref:Uncharacterized protein n=1 Tax=Pseudoalteromonas luteoviolacea S4054 TaxID=1129367 RepID=A0A0F6A9S4_9GAMM|nr:hypothetical protein [Pseudoalteromonas luteoviolacea]AOT08779.1 hypothetical protein S4054249_13355 [Pseudoalteromonas luteoviolacea]AOT13693.1 hypothetical protein S40542_13325 [Pseudoalteromonas luteoviolacea]AOT18607.1 hypothetical protein S4054_13330 [Pseudoalteromonas luteoviolacea]KKE82925.1 hypothetical protein N479_16065 [Pseudoalteromonas luteoviolacea S4054]KZN72711.1 hypothetical protein N481_00925 [Pseudoalteromonas luteoviolacea S4047-1]